MKRSALTRKTPLAQGDGLKRRTPLRSVAPKTPQAQVEWLNQKSARRCVNTPGHGTEEVTSMRDQPSGDRRGVQRVCQECGREFLAQFDCATRTSKYCSRECGWTVQKRAAAEDLPAADELHRLHHEQELSVAAIGRHYGRSDWWAKKALAARGVPQRAVAITGTTVRCAECGREFYAKASQLKRGGGKYCSVACSRAIDRRTPEQVAKLSADLRESRKGTGNPSYKHGRYAGRTRAPHRWNLRVKGERDCRNCGRPASHLHHIIPRAKSRAACEDVTHNGLPLCAECHRGWHDRIVVMDHHVMRDEEFAFVVALAGSAWVERNYPDEPVGALVTLDRVKRGYWLHPDSDHEPMRLRTLRLLGDEWLPEASLVAPRSVAA